MASGLCADRVGGEMMMKRCSPERAKVFDSVMAFCRGWAASVFAAWPDLRPEGQ